MFKVWGANASPFVRKVRVALVEKGIDYELEPIIPINVSAEFKRISPLGKIPVLQHGERTLPDSSVICAYLERVQPAPALYPSDPYDYGRALWFEEYADTALVTTFGGKIFFPLVIAPRFLDRKPDMAAVQKAVDEDLPPLFGYLESQLATDGWLAGRTFSVGDIGVGSQFVNLRHAGFGVDAARWPELARYIDRLHGRPSFKQLIDEETAAFTQAA